MRGTNSLMHVPALREPRVQKQPFSRLTDGQEHPVTVRKQAVVALVPSEPAMPAQTGLTVACRTDGTQELGYKEVLPRGGSWREVRIDAHKDACGYGCKVYAAPEFPAAEVVHHNSAYGCPIAEVLPTPIGGDPRPRR